MKTKLGAAATPPAATSSNPEADDPVEEDPELCEEEEDPEIYEEEEDPEEEIEGEWEEVEEEIEEEVDDDGEDEDEERVPEPVKRKRKLREFEVFVGGLPREAVEEDLARALMRVGEVVEVRLVRDPVTGLNKGFAFVRFATVEQARRAVVEVKLVQVKGKICGLTRNNENESLHLGNICRTWTKDDLIEKLEAFELENLEEVDLIEDPNNMGMNRGYAFLHFSTHMDAVAALFKLQKRVIFFGVDVRAEVNFSRVGQPDEEVMAHVKSVFLDGLPVTWDEPQVREHFEQFGQIESVRLARNLPNAKRKNFGFIYFAARQAALDCIEVVNKDGVSEGSGKVLIKATLRKPRLKQTHPMLGVRRGYIGKNYELRPQSYVANRSYPGRLAESRGFFGKRGFRGQFSSRGRFFPPTEKFGGRPREDFVRDIPAFSYDDRVQVRLTIDLETFMCKEAYLEVRICKVADLEVRICEAADLEAHITKAADFEAHIRRIADLEALICNARILETLICSAAVLENPIWSATVLEAPICRTEVLETPICETADPENPTCEVGGLRTPTHKAPDLGSPTIEDAAGVAVEKLRVIRMLRIRKAEGNVVVISTMSPMRFMSILQSHTRLLTLN